MNIKRFIKAFSPPYKTITGFIIRIRDFPRVLLKYQGSGVPVHAFAGNSALQIELLYCHRKVGTVREFDFVASPGRGRPRFYSPTALAVFVLQAQNSFQMLLLVRADVIYELGLPRLFKRRRVAPFFGVLPPSISGLGLVTAL